MNNQTNPNLIEDALEKFVLDQDHPCLMAQSVFKTENVLCRSYDSFDSILTANAILKEIESYVENYDFDSNDNQTFIAVFPKVEIQNAVEFEQRLWKLMELIHHYDQKGWDPDVSNDPNHPNFSMSIAGKAFYLVGMHPKSERVARQTPFPMIAFNMHHQFDKLREMGVYDQIRDKIRERDLQMNGSVNPMLEDFGSQSEAKQYSGRIAKEDWKCPFHKSAI